MGWPQGLLLFFKVKRGFGFLGLPRLVALLLLGFWASGLRFLPGRGALQCPYADNNDPVL